MSFGSQDVLLSSATINFDNYCGAKCDQGFHHMPALAFVQN